MLAAVVLNFGTPARTLACARSLESSTRPPDRLLLVDNGSGDGAALRAGAPRAQLIELPRNLGFAGGMNAGLRAALDAGADRLLVANSDLVVAPGCVAALDAALAEPGVGIAGPVLLDLQGRVESRGLAFSPASGRMRSRGHGEPPPGDHGVQRVDGVSGALLLIARDVLERVGAFDEDYFYGFEDLDLCLRARAAGFAVVCAHAARATHEGAATVGAAAPVRLYYATRNHLRLAGLRAPRIGLAGAARTAHIIALNALHALLRAPAPPLQGTLAVARGVADHLRGRYGGADRP
jgi:GT2 family glycosyltransferase